jgi:UDP-N-acetylbacillosamine N-acetyltransferase
MPYELDYSKKLFIYGCGGHARSLADVAVSNGGKDLIFIDEGARENEVQLGFPVVKPFSDKIDGNYIVAIGDNHHRALVFHELRNKNLIVLISNTAYMGVNTQLDIGTFIAAGAHIGPNTIIAENTIINTRAIVEHDCKIGKHSHISVNAVVAGKAELGDFVMIGAGAIVIDNIKVCSEVTVGAGSVVIKDINMPGVYVGVPARRISS